MLDDDAERLLDVQRAEHTDRMRKLRKAKREGSLAAEGALAPENQFAAIAYVGIVIAALLSAVSLTVSAISSVIQRRRAIR